MAVWSVRSAGYKLGVLLVFLASGFYFVGFASPFWLSSGSYYFSGLWMTCYRASRFASSVQCVTTSGTGPTGSGMSWHKAVQAMESIGLIGVFISCVYAFVVNCCQRFPPHNRFLEILSAASGVSGFIATMIFVGKMKQYGSDFYGWAFGLNLAGCLLLMVSAVVIFVANKDVLTSPAPGGVVTYAPGVQGPNVVYPPAGPQPLPGQMYPPPGPQPGYVIQQPGYGQPQGYSGAVMYPGVQVQPTAPPSGGYAVPPPPEYSAYSYYKGKSAQEGAAVPEPK